MIPVKRRYSPLAVKAFFSVGYVLFFLVQLNARYYSIANFFSYGEQNTVLQSRDHAGKLPVATQGHQDVVARFNNSPRTNKAHLSIDKRYFGKYAVAILPTPCRTAPFRIVVKEDEPLTRNESIVISPDHPVHSLRGPPRA